MTNRVSPVTDAMVTAGAKAAAEAAGFCWENCAQSQWERDMRAGLEAALGAAATAGITQALDDAVVALQSIVEHPGEREVWDDARAALPRLMTFLEDCCVPGWLPIHTAPKDGTVIEIINMDAGDPQPFPAHWAQSKGDGEMNRRG